MTLGALRGGGLTWTAGVLGALAALLGVATGRRALALPGAALVAAVCALDGARDLYGGGSRWVAMFVDVLPALLPAALLLLLAATRPRPHTLRATAWTLAATAALILTALAIEENTTTGTTVLAAGSALAALAFLRGHLAWLAAAPAACVEHRRRRALSPVRTARPGRCRPLSATRLRGHRPRTRAQ